MDGCPSAKQRADNSSHVGRGKEQLYVRANRCDCHGRPVDLCFEDFEVEGVSPGTVLEIFICACL